MYCCVLTLTKIGGGISLNADFKGIKNILGLNTALNKVIATPVEIMKLSKIFCVRKKSYQALLRNKKLAPQQKITTIFL
ncbi:MAG: hypothetical protein ACI9LM_000753 [Alteromonadaceae bacterium]|jgi:hypothetical protein